MERSVLHCIHIIFNYLCYVICTANIMLFDELTVRNIAILKSGIVIQIKRNEVLD